MLLVRARCGLRGGNANNGLNAGFGYVNVNNDVGNANTNYGGRLHAFLKMAVAITLHRAVGESMFRRELVNAKAS